MSPGCGGAPPGDLGYVGVAQKPLDPAGAVGQRGVVLIEGNHTEFQRLTGHQVERVRLKDQAVHPLNSGRVLAGERHERDGQGTTQQTWADPASFTHFGSLFHDVSGSPRS